MKTTIFNRFSRCLATALLLTAVSCTDNIDCPKISGDEVTVSFTLSPEDLTPATRADVGDAEGDYRHEGISGGTYIDELIYAVYDENFNLLEDYGNDPEGAERGDHGKGQTVVQDIKEFPCTVKITLKRGQTYNIAFWAQSSRTDAYNTTDLRKVEVNYKRLAVGSDGYSNDDYHARNNDEYRDAFCRSVQVEVGGKESGNIQKNVYLYRPLAQINVGTAGFDYELVTRGASQKYTYSKIRINRVARYLDVAKDEIYASSTSEDDTYYGDETSESFAVVDFEYAPIPAYIFNGSKDRVVPEHPSYTRFDWEYQKYDKKKPLPHNTSIGYDPDFYPYESFLQLKHPKYWSDNDPIDGTAPLDDNGYIGYANYYDYNEALTETYKYLSMCYVLTNSTKEQATTINNIKVWLAADADGKDEIELFSIDNVPVQRNWRTNIVGNLLTEEVSLNVSMDKNFAGEYNGKYDTGANDKWEAISGPISDGVYYDAKADEILISNLNGLIWFQQMVNGKMTVREDFENGSSIGESYPYYIGSDTYYLPNEFVDPSKLSDEVLKRIIKATHIDKTNSGYNDKGNTKVGSNNDIIWQDHYRFNFYGAKVKLMADIDLADIDWIPIGFDLAIHDTSCGYATGKPQGSKIKLDYIYANHTHGSRRMFCGTFDGNGHSIYNLKNKRFGAQVHDYALQNGSGKDSPYDNVQWMPAGFFGLIGDGATIKNLKLVNVDIFGYNAAGAIAGIANSSSKNTNDYTPSPVRIDNCSVEGGRIYLSPMYRGDNKGEPSSNWDDDLETSRSFARGIYAGGIVGQMSVAKGDKESGITNCSVSGTFIHAYRRAGGILGSISNSEQADWNNIDEKEITITDNRLSDVTIITNKFQAYHRLFHDFQNNVWKNGYGWNGSQAALGGIFVGGMVNETYLDNYNNTQNGVVFSDFATNADVKAATPRSSEIGNISLDLMPMLSSWFTDEIALKSNFYGAPSAKTVVGHHAYKAWIQNRGNYSNVTIQVPMKLPTDLSIDYTEAPNAGLYVESVRLDGKDAIGERSVITANEVADEGACVMFVTARDRKQFETKLPSITNAHKNEWSAAQSTIIHNMVLRGSPYAWAGLLISPNANMSKVVVDNVHIYDVYQTVALNPESKLMDDTNLWPNTNVQKATGVELEFNNSNWRGYTNPGDGWKSVSYTNMTFESGMNVNQTDDYKTLMVGATETATTFTDCIFKAPFVIDMTSASATFVTCSAAAAAVGNVPINLDLVKDKGVCKKIEISSNIQGEPQVTYYVGDDRYDQDGNKIVEEEAS